MKTHSDQAIEFFFGEDDPFDGIHDLETAYAKGLWGCRWASIAAQHGLAVAVASPLPAALEAEMLKNLEWYSIDQSATQPFAMFPTLAEDTYRFAVLQISKYLRSQAPSVELLRETEQAIGRAEFNGRYAASASRLILHLTGMDPRNAKREDRP